MLEIFQLNFKRKRQICIFSRSQEKRLDMSSDLPLYGLFIHLPITYMAVALVGNSCSYICERFVPRMKLVNTESINRLDDES